MFNSTHTLTGFVLARAGLDRWAPYATWTAVIASNLPDIDIVVQFAGTTTYLDQHRGITHAVVGVPILSLALAAVMHAISKSRGKPHASLWTYFAVALTAMATHPLLDWANTYGIRPFLPFDPTWYYGDTLFIIDPMLDLILLSGLILSSRSLSRRRLAAGLTIVAAVGYIALRVELREIARQQLAEYSRNVPGLVSSAVQPLMLNLLAWAGFVQTETDVSRLYLNLIDGKSEVVSRMPGTPDSQVTQAAETTRTGKVFRSFARFPVTRVETTDSGYRVLLIDFRFLRQSNAGATALAAEILMDRSLRIERESVSFIQPIPDSAFPQ